MSTPRFRILAAVAGIAASLFLAAPARADDTLVKAINDGEAVCTDTGFIYVPWHIGTNNHTNITNLDSVPSLNNFVSVQGGIKTPWEGSLINEFVPNGTTSPALTFTWTDTETDETGTGSGTTTQKMPKCDGAPISATYVACGNLVDVTLHNGTKSELTFFINDVQHTVAANSSTTIKGVAPDEGGDVVTFVKDETFGAIPTDMFHFDGPATCAPAPSNSPAPPALAVTGSKLTGLIGAGGGLLVLGALFVALSVLRRRRNVDTAAGS